MSIVAVKNYKDKIVIGSDSIRVRGYTQAKKEFCKMIEVEKGFVISGAGLARDHILLAEYATSNKPKRETYDGILDWFGTYHEWLKKKTGENNVKIENSYLIVFNKRIYRFHDYYLEEVDNYEAIGAGMDYALTALYLGESVEKAVECACELSIYCEKPINIIEIKK